MPHDTDSEQETAQQQSNSGVDYPSLEEILIGYLDTRGAGNVAQVSVGEEGFKHGSLVVTGHTAVNDELPEIVADTDIVTQQGYQYELIFEEDPYGPSTHGRITLYASDTISGMDAVSLEDGLAAVEDHVRQLINDGKAPRAPSFAE